ncbi:MAG: hypothetical protein QOD88_4079, partial [Mycobacterium sp.]|nr:hypothetical protein [Mycobacterium sp.]
KSTLEYHLGTDIADVASTTHS